MANVMLEIVLMHLLTCRGTVLTRTLGPICSAAAPEIEGRYCFPCKDGSYLAVHAALAECSDTFVAGLQARQQLSDVVIVHGLHELAVVERGR